MKIEVNCNARGRNGRFTAKRIDIWNGTGGVVYLDVFSQKQARTPPIELELNREAAGLLGAALISKAGLTVKAKDEA